MKIVRYLIFGIFLFLQACLSAQEFERKDSLRGSITEERAWWDLLHYEIDVNVDIPKKFISGKNTLTYSVVQQNEVLQIDLQEPMRITAIKQGNEFLTYKKEQGAYFVNLHKAQDPGQQKKLEVWFEGNPPESMNPPWDGGFVWQKDLNHKPFVANANQLLGSSSWLPSKDIPYDEPDNGMQIKITTDSSLVSVSNGRLMKKESSDDGTNSFTWKVINPINGYGINVNIGQYTHFKDTYQGEKGELDLDFYVLPYNLEKAKQQFVQVPMMLEAFEYWFGPYPFYEDGYKLVEVPYLGMEHQSSVTYGNGYQNGYRGMDLSGSGMGYKFDYVLIHESGHEWFANSITNYDVADMWIHESFTTYSEVLYLDYHFGKEAADKYLIGYRSHTLNLSPVTGTYEVNQRGSGDMYIKGAAMIHTLRQVINDDDQFRELLRGINKTFYHQTISSAQLEAYIIKETGLDLQGFFDQYLRTIKIPEIQYKVKKGILSFRLRNTVPGFKIPVRLLIDNKAVWITPTTDWQEYQLPTADSSIRIDENFYINLHPR